MTKTSIQPKPESQLAKFKEAARAVETDDSEKAFDQNLKRVARTRSKPEQVSKK